MDGLGGGETKLLVRVGEFFSSFDLLHQVSLQGLDDEVTRRTF